MMNNDAEKLLMMFIRDSYATSTGMPTKKTLIALMKYVSSDEELQSLLNIGDYKKILTHKP